MDERPPTIQQGTAEGKKRINTKLASTLLLPHCLSFPFYSEKSKKSLCHSHFRALKNAIIQQRSAISNIMVNIYCWFSYSKPKLQHLKGQPYHLASQCKQYYFLQTTLCCISDTSQLIPIFLLPSTFPISTTCAKPVRRDTQQSKPVCNILG